MTPLLGTTGGGSGRGFGRGFKSAAAPAGPSAAPSGLSATPAYAGSSTTAQMSLSWTNGDATSQTEVYNGASLVTTVNAGVATYTVASLNAMNSMQKIMQKGLKAGFIRAKELQKEIDN